ncbi:MAG: hypothetical protein IT558_00735 [Alphaproteobacteria bacterium]|nr:hypothetical protein [Alphaproteobacteria bacterium]
MAEWTPDFAPHLTLKIAGTVDRGGYSRNICTYYRERKIVKDEAGRSQIEEITIDDPILAQAKMDEIQDLAIHKEFVVKPDLLKALPDSEKRTILNDKGKPEVDFKNDPVFFIDEQGKLGADFSIFNDPAAVITATAVLEAKNR